MTMRAEPLASHSPILDNADHVTIADGLGRDTRSLSYARRGHLRSGEGPVKNYIAD